MARNRQASSPFHRPRAKTRLLKPWNDWIGTTTAASAPSSGFDYKPGDQVNGVPHSSGALTLTYSGRRTSAELSAEHTGEALQANYDLYADGLYRRLNAPPHNSTLFAARPA